MELVSGFQALLQELSPTMTAPSFLSFCTVAAGWLISGRGVVTRMITAAGSGATKHYSSYYRFLNAASWSLDKMGLWRSQHDRASLQRGRDARPR